MRRRVLAKPLVVVAVPADTTAPTVPTNVTASSLTATGFTLSWSASSDAVGVTGYVVQIDGVTYATPTGTSIGVAGRSASTTYAVRVQARDAAGNFSALSTAINVTTPAAADVTAPTVPTGVTTSAVTATGFTVSWTASTDAVGVTGYDVQIDGTSYATPTTTSVAVTGRAASTAYAVRVRARDAAGNFSALSTAVNVTTLAQVPVAAFTGTPVSGTVPLAVQFTSTSTGSPTSYAWTFGDGGTATTASPSHTYTTAGTYTVALTVTNTAGSNTQTRTSYVAATAAAAVSLYSTQTPTTPDANDGQAITLSTRFVSDAAGTVTGIRFYRATTSPSSVVGLLYSDTGTELARATFGTLTAGWNTVTFATPVAVAASTYYRAAYWTSGPYVATVGQFTTEMVNGHLTGTSGFYVYGASPAFGTGAGDSYFADVLFAVSGAAIATAPATPAAPAVSVGDGSLAVSWVAPANGGSAITGYDVQPFIGATGGTVVSVGNVLGTTLTGLTNGTAYTVKVRAKNAIGSSAYSAASSAATPGAPGGSTITHGFQVTTANAGITAYVDPTLGRTITNADLTVHAGLVSLSDVMTAGGTLTRHWFQGGLTIDIDNVTFVGCRFNHGVSGYWSGIHHPFTMNWCTVEGSPDPVGYGSVYYQDYTIYRCYIACEMDGLKANGNITATECVIRVNTASPDDHNDGAQSTGSYTGNLIQRCNIDARPLNGSGGGAGGPNAALFVADASNGLHRWYDNYVAGGGYVIRCYEDATYDVQGNWILDQSWIFGPASRAVIPATSVTWGTVRNNLIVSSAGSQVSVATAP